MALKLIRKFAVASLLTLLSSATVSAQTLVFTAIPDEDETKLVERFTGIADYLAGELDVDVRYIPVKSFTASVSMLPFSISLSHTEKLIAPTS